MVKQETSRTACAAMDDKVVSGEGGNGRKFVLYQGGRHETTLFGLVLWALWVLPVGLHIPSHQLCRCVLIAQNGTGLAL
jgi:hypothetical protein